jgi:hypothetical protein
MTRLERKLKAYRAHIELFGSSGHTVRKGEITKGRKLIRRVERYLQRNCRPNRKLLKFTREISRNYIRQNLFAPELEPLSEIIQFINDLKAKERACQASASHH